MDNIHTYMGDRGSSWLEVEGVFFGKAMEG